MNNLPEWNEERAKLIFEAIPEANWVACDAAGCAKWFDRKPQIGADSFWSSGVCSSLGKFSCHDWTKSLYERKWRPKQDERVYIVELNYDEGFQQRSFQTKNSTFNRLLARNLIFRTEEEAKARFEELMGVGK